MACSCAELSLWISRDDAPPSSMIGSRSTRATSSASFADRKASLSRGQTQKRTALAKSEIRNPESSHSAGARGGPSPKIRVRSSAEGGVGGSLEIVEIVSGARYLMSSKSQVRSPTWPLVIVKHLRNPEFPNPKSKMSAEGRKVPLNPESPNPKSDTPPER